MEDPILKEWSERILEARAWDDFTSEGFAFFRWHQLTYFWEKDCEGFAVTRSYTPSCITDWETIQALAEGK